MKQRTKFAVGVAIILGTIVWLGWVGVSQSKTYYHTITELATLSGNQLRQRMRVSGNVVQGSIQRLPGRVDFVLEEQGKTLPVSYVGTDPLPDTFKDGSQALVEGREMPDGRFLAEQVQAKCASKYESAPDQQKSGTPGPNQGKGGASAAGAPYKKS